MVRILLSGCNGRVGQAVSRLCQTRTGFKILAGIDINTAKQFDYPVYADPMEFNGRAGVIIDFSAPSSLPALLRYAVRNSLPIVICTTGHTPEQEELIKKASEEIPVFNSANMSLGVNLMTALVKKAARILGDTYDIEIVEKHHNQKVDAPSGTALMIYREIASSLSYKADAVYSRNESRVKRGKNEIGIHSVRGGTIVGEHEVIFAGHDEIIEFKHTALSREVFASGALKAAEFLRNCKSGLYNMDSVVSDQE